MRSDELERECLSRLGAGLEWMQLKVPGRMRGQRKRIAPGLYGRAIGELDGGLVLVDVPCAAVLQWLMKMKERWLAEQAADTASAPRSKDKEES